MKKRKLSVLLLIACMTLSLVACGGSDKKAETNKDATIGDGVNTEVEADTPVNEVKLGDTIELDFVKMTLDEFEVVAEYNFESIKETSVGTTTRRASITPDGGMKLVCLKGQFSNLTQGEIFPANEPLYGEMIINGNTYSAKMECYNVEGAERIMTVAAQQEVSYFFYAEVPENVANSIETCEVNFGFVTDFETKYISAVKDLDYVYALNTVPNSK